MTADIRNRPDNRAADTASPSTPLPVRAQCFYMWGRDVGEYFDPHVGEEKREQAMRDLASIL